MHLLTKQSAYITLLGILLALSCNKKESPTEDTPTSTSEGLGVATTEHPLETAPPVAGALILNGLDLAATSTEAQTQSSDQNPEAIAGLCTACNELLKAATDFNLKTRTQTLLQVLNQPIQDALLRNQKFCTDIGALRDLENGIEDQLNIPPPEVEDPDKPDPHPELAKNMEVINTATNELKDIVHSYVVQFEAVRSDKALVENMNQHCKN